LDKDDDTREEKEQLALAVIPAPQCSTILFNRSNESNNCFMIEGGDGGLKGRGTKRLRKIDQDGASVDIEMRSADSLEECHQEQ
jgi:hypothetical protein